MPFTIARPGTSRGSPCRPHQNKTATVTADAVTVGWADLAGFQSFFIPGLIHLELWIDLIHILFYMLRQSRIRGCESAAEAAGYVYS